MSADQRAVLRFVFTVRLGLIVATVLFVMLFRAPTAAGQTQVRSVATAVSVQGIVDAQARGGAEWHPVKLNDALAAGDTIRVGEKSRADVSLLDQSILRLNENTTITIQAPKQQTGVVDMLRGAAHFFSRGPKSWKCRPRSPSPASAARSSRCRSPRGKRCSRYSRAP